MNLLPSSFLTIVEDVVRDTSSHIVISTSIYVMDWEYKDVRQFAHYVDVSLIVAKGV